MKKQTILLCALISGGAKTASAGSYQPPAIVPSFLPANSPRVMIDFPAQPAGGYSDYGNSGPVTRSFTWVPDNPGDVPADFFSRLTVEHTYIFSASADGTEAYSFAYATNRFGPQGEVAFVYNGNHGGYSYGSGNGIEDFEDYAPQPGQTNPTFSVTTSENSCVIIGGGPQEGNSAKGTSGPNTAQITNFSLRVANP